MAASAQEKIVAQCRECSAKMRVPASAKGKKARCPKCSAVFVVKGAAAAPGTQPAGSSSSTPSAPPTSEPAAPTSPPPPPPGGGDDDLLGALAAQESSAAASDQPLFQKQPHREAKLKQDPAAKKPKGETGAAVAALTGGGGKLLLGVGISAVGTAVAAAVWVFVAIQFDLQLGLIAWALGVAAGFGMAVTGRGMGPAGGGIAAAFAILGILAAKFLILSFFQVAVANAPAADIAPRELALQMMEADGVDPVALSGQNFEREFESRLTFAERRVAQMKPAEVEELADAARARFQMDFADMWHLMDILFVLLAIGSAYKLGSDGFGGK